MCTKKPACKSVWLRLTRAGPVSSARQRLSCSSPQKWHRHLDKTPGAGGFKERQSSLSERPNREVNTLTQEQRDGDGVSSSNPPTTNPSLPVLWPCTLQPCTLTGGRAKERTKKREVKKEKKKKSRSFPPSAITPP